MKCPNCLSGYNSPLIFLGDRKVADFPCAICKGTDELPDDITYDPEKGLKIMDDRVLAGYTLRQWCKESGEDVVIRSEQERGYFREIFHVSGKEEE